MKDVKIPKSVSKELLIISILDTLCDKYTPIYYMKSDFKDLSYNSIGYMSIPANCIGVIKYIDGKNVFTFYKL